MRLWSLHPKYLDAKGLVALWREALLAKHVLEEKTKGYRKHPQLLRFLALQDPVAAINEYLSAVYSEAERRGYHFDNKKFSATDKNINIQVTQGQMEYEFGHLMSKLKIRDPRKFAELSDEKEILPHPILTVVQGPVCDWERTRQPESGSAK